jgi:hypothetical protein
VLGCALLYNRVMRRAHVFVAIRSTGRIAAIRYTWDEAQTVAAARAAATGQPYEVVSYDESIAWRPGLERVLEA